jgi:hypothetical protein
VTYTVVLHRQTKTEPEYGYLRAWIEQYGRRGSNLLAGRHLTGIDTAKLEVTRLLQRISPGAQIVFEGPADALRAVDGGHDAD